MGKGMLLLLIVCRDNISVIRHFHEWDLNTYKFLKAFLYKCSDIEWFLKLILPWTYFFAIFLFFPKNIFFSYNIFWIQFPLPILVVLTHIPSQIDILPFCLSLEHHRHPRDRNKQNKILWEKQYHHTKVGIDKPTKVKEPKKRPTHSHTHQSHKNIKVSTKMHSRPLQALCLLFESLWVHKRFTRV